MVDINKLIEYLEASSDTAYFIYKEAKKDGDELAAMRSITQVSEKMLFIEMLKDETFLDKMYKVFFPDKPDAD